MGEDPDIVVVSGARLEPERLRAIVRATFVDMAKFVVDVDRGLLAVGGELHADAEQRLIEAGSTPGALWGANYYPGRGRDGCIEFTALINSPARGNPGMEVEDEAVRARIRALTFALLGEGEAL